MAQSVIGHIESTSPDNSISTREFLQFEKKCEAFRDSDEEIKMIFKEINKLSANNKSEKVISEDTDDVELILRRAEDIAQETQNLLLNTPLTPKSKPVTPSKSKPVTPSKSKPSMSKQITPSKSNGEIPQIKVTKAAETELCFESKELNKANQYAKQNVRENIETRRKPKLRPFSAGVIDSKKRDTTKIVKSVSNSPKKSLDLKHADLLEELKDTTERTKSLEIANVQLNDDNKALRKRLEQVSESKHMAELKLTECEKFVSRISKEYENRNSELKSVKESENRILVELNKERNDRKNLSVQHDKDLVVIQDLQRQVKEMELILKRKHPDSVSALIVASKSSTVEDNKKKLLEERIARLEQELKDKESHFQGILLTLQEKFGDMKQKYESHIIDVERQLMDDRKLNTDLKNRINRCNLVSSATQTVARNQHTAATQTVLKPDRASSAVSRLSQNSALILNKLKEDSYLVATIKGLQSELTVKQRAIAKINRETEELRKNLRNSQKEKEVLLNLNPQKRSAYRTKSTENILARMNTEMEAELSELRKQREVLSQERNTLLDSLKRTNEEFILLKKKRIQDLHTLQVAHEKELMQMNMQIYPLQEEIKMLNRTVEILQERVRSADDKVLRYHAGIRDEMHAGGDSNNTRKNAR